MDFIWKWVIAKRAAGKLLPRVVSAVNEALSGGLENVRALGFIMPAARTSPDGQETAPRGDKEA